MAEVNAARSRLDEIYAAYAEPDADFDALAAEQGELEAKIAAAGTDSEHQLEIAADALRLPAWDAVIDRKSTRLNSSHANISYAVFCLKKKQNDRYRPSI